MASRTEHAVTDFNDLDVDPDELEVVEVSDDVESWIAEMLAGPSEDRWDY